MTDTKSDGGAPQTPAAERRSSDEEGWEEGYKACKAGAQQAGGAAVQEALAVADESAKEPGGCHECHALVTLAAEVRRLQAHKRDLVAAYRRDREKGLTIEFHCVGVGSDPCGAPLTAANIYRCGDCDQTYCQPCLKKHFAAHAGRLQAQPTAQEPPVLSLNEAYQRICDLFAYEENEKRLNDGLLHILRMATTPQRDSGLDALLREAREALWREHATGTPMHALRDYCTRCALIAKLDAAMQTRGQTDFVQRSSSDCTTVPGLSGDGSVAERK